MKVVALYGESGTGKSSSALVYAHEKQIEAIIDDGLFIKDGKSVAGISAKFEKNPLTAVKRAIFINEEHCQAVKSAIEHANIQSILIIGTSKKMTIKIANRLELGEIDEFVDIRTIRSEEEILLAKYVREMQGKHTMPLPKSEVQQNFFQRMVQKGRDIFSAKKEKIGETTLVSPDFHPQTIFIEDKVYEDVLSYVVQKNPFTKQLHRVHFKFTEHLPIVYIDLTIAAPVTYYVPEMLEQLQQEIFTAFYSMFQLKLTTIQIHVRGIQT